MTLGRTAVQATLVVLVALLFFGLGTFMTARQAAESDARMEALRAEMALMRHEASPRGTSGSAASLPTDSPALAALVEDIKRQLQDEMGLLPVRLLRERRESFVELYAYDNRGGSSYGTAGYLGEGYFITVKHGVIALGRPGEDRREPRRITSIRLMYQGREIPATLVDAGDADAEVDPGDWAIVKVRQPVGLPPLRVDLDFSYSFAEPIFRLGNDYSKGIILSTGYIGQRTANHLVTCLTDGHPGVSGGGVLNQQGDLVGIPIGRMQGDYRFSFILPLRQEMFRKLPFAPAGAAGRIERDVVLAEAPGE